MTAPAPDPPEHTVCSECRIDGTCVNDPAPEPVEVAASELAAAGVMEMSARMAGMQQCSMGNHVWTPWLQLSNGSYVTVCARCNHEVQYDT